MTDTNFWLARWREGRTGWHQDRVNAWLEHYWPTLGLPRGARVLVPLCGKTLDMAWLAGQGLQVLGIELSALAIEQFFAEHELRPHRRDTPDGVVHAAGGIEIIQGDLFAVRPETLAGCGAVYDRAAVIALSADERERYAAAVYANLPAGCRGLAITLDYPQAEMPGPPFSVDAGEMQRLIGASWICEALERRDILEREERFRKAGVTSLHTAVYRVSRR